MSKFTNFNIYNFLLPKYMGILKDSAKGNITEIRAKDSLI